MDETQPSGGAVPALGHAAPPDPDPRRRAAGRGAAASLADLAPDRR